MGISREEIERQKRERLGEERYNYYGTLMRIVEYNNSSDITVEFQDEYKVKIKNREYKEFLKGGIKNPYDKEVCNVGYIGIGKYKSRIDGKKTNAYKEWVHLLRRCYDPYCLNKRQTYIDVFVCDEWLCFQNFAEWFYNNYYEIEGQRMHLDKDILIKGNKIYSPETCIFVPQRINTLFNRQGNHRGSYPIGVYFHKNCLYVQCNIYRKGQKYLGDFPLNRPFQAFTVYKNFKENYIKQVADEYKDLIPKELYEALYKYEVEIND